MGKGSNTTTQSSAPPPEVMQAYQNVVNRAQGVASTPLSQYSGNMIAGFTPQQMQGFQTVQDNQGIWKPYLNSAAQLTAAGTAPITPMGFSADQVGQYMSPYTNQVVDATLANFDHDTAVQNNGLVSNAIGSGAFGGDRPGVASAEMLRGRDLARGQLEAGMRQQGYGQALGEFNTQQQAGTQAQQANDWLAQNAGYAMAGLGREAQSAGMADAAALSAAGSQQQQLAQAQLNIPYQMFQQQQGYPFQTTNFLAGVTEGAGSLMGGTGQTTSPGPSALGQAAGLATTGLGLYGLYSALPAVAAMSQGGRAVPHYAGGGTVGLAAGLLMNRGRQGYAPGGPVAGFSDIPAIVDYVPAPASGNRGAGPPKPPNPAQPENYGQQLSDNLFRMAGIGARQQAGMRQPGMTVPPQVLSGKPPVPSGEFYPPIDDPAFGASVDELFAPAAGAGAMEALGGAGGLAGAGETAAEVAPFLMMAARRGGRIAGFAEGGFTAPVLTPGRGIPVPQLSGAGNATSAGFTPPTPIIGHNTAAPAFSGSGLDISPTFYWSPPSQAEVAGMGSLPAPAPMAAPAPAPASLAGMTGTQAFAAAPQSVQGFPGVSPQSLHPITDYATGQTIGWRAGDSQFDAAGNLFSQGSNGDNGGAWRGGRMAQGGMALPGMTHAGFDDGGEVAPGQDPRLAQLEQLPLERLYEMAVRFPPETEQGRLVHAAIMQKRMTVATQQPQPAQPQPGVQAPQAPQPGFGGPFAPGMGQGQGYDDGGMVDDYPFPDAPAPVTSDDYLSARPVRRALALRETPPSTAGVTLVNPFSRETSQRVAEDLRQIVPGFGAPAAAAPAAGVEAPPTRRAENDFGNEAPRIDAAPVAGFGEEAPLPQDEAPDAGAGDTAAPPVPGRNRRRAPQRAYPDAPNQMGPRQPQAGMAPVETQPVPIASGLPNAGFGDADSNPELGGRNGGDEAAPEGAQQPAQQAGMTQPKQGGSWLTSPWLAVLNAGLGMMASRSPHFANAVGEGGQAGIKTLFTQRDAENAATKLAQDADRHKAELAERREAHQENAATRRETAQTAAEARRDAAQSRADATREAAQARADAQRYSADQAAATRGAAVDVARINAESGKFELVPGTGVDPETGQTVPGTYSHNKRTGEIEFKPGIIATPKPTAAGADTAQIKNVKFLLDNNLATTKEQAWAMARAGVNNQAQANQFTRLVQSEKKRLQDSPNGMKLSEADLHKQAMENVAATNPGSAAPAAAPTAAPAATPAPAPAKGEAKPAAAPTPPAPLKDVQGLQWSPSRKQWRDPANNTVYDATGKPVE